MLTLERLSALSWRALEHEMAGYLKDLPPEAKAPVTKALWHEIKPKIQQAWSIGKGTGVQTLFFFA